MQWITIDWLFSVFRRVIYNVSVPYDISEGDSVPPLLELLIHRPPTLRRDSIPIQESSPCSNVSSRDGI